MQIINEREREREPMSPIAAYMFWQCQHYSNVTNCEHPLRRVPATRQSRGVAALSHACHAVVTYNYSRLRLQDLERGRLDSVYQFHPAV